MPQNDKPFEGILGNTVELRLVEHLLSVPKLDFNVSELARVAEVSRSSVHRVIKKLLRWEVVRPVSQRGNMTFYSIDRSSRLVEALYELNGAVIEMMYPEVYVPGIRIEATGHALSVEQALPFLEAEVLEGGGVLTVTTAQGERSGDSSTIDSLDISSETEFVARSTAGMQ